MKYLLVLCAALAATFAIKGALEPDPVEYRQEGPFRLGQIEERAPEMSDQEMLDFIGNVLYLDTYGVDTELMRMPDVKAGFRWGVLGWYDPYNDPDTVWVSSRLVRQYGWDSYEVREVILHETAHYIDYRYRGAAYDRWGNAHQWSEENAWHVGNTWWNYTGYPENAEYGWYSWYGFDEARPVTPWDPRQ